ncbi:hypothetical protein FRB93_010623 [Tulasnella sp. JGI-2019a]|nr:hypothetical protein FRB93_010623 [Tulasnella sp. JGI-2019a]
MFGVVGLLTALNYALAGFETVTITSPSVANVPSHWYSNFASPPPGSDYEPRIFNIGDTFVTNSAIFTWSVAGILSGPVLVDAGNNVTSAASVSYNGTNLDNCDWVDISVEADTNTMTTAFTSKVFCNGIDFSVILGTTFTAKDLHPPPNNTLPVFVTQSSAAEQIHELLWMAGSNLTGKLVEILATGNHSYGVGATVLYAYIGKSNPDEFCHNQRLGTVPPSCLTVPPSLGGSEEHLIFSSGASGLYDNAISPYGAAMNNSLQMMMAAVRLDIGNIFPNNILVYPGPINATISPITDNIDTDLYFHLYGGVSDTTLKEVPINTSQPAIVATEYLCHVQMRKSLGPLVIAVLVATLSMFSSGWAALILVSTYFEKRRYGEANFCDGHFDVEGNQHNRSQNETDGIPLLGSRRK